MRSPKTALPASSEGGGSADLKRVAHLTARRQSRPGVGSADKQNPKAQRNRKIEAWCQGKAERYA